MIHTVFDILAWTGGILGGLWVRRHWLAAAPAPTLTGHPFYFACAVVGAVLGAVALGTANMALSGVPGVGRSIVGGLLGAIVAVELYKRCRGVSGSTGIVFVVPLALGIAIGRVGCLVSGLDDFTYGVPTTLPWGWDFGDGVPRHPVQLYESLVMTGFLVWFLAALAGGRPLARRHGFAVFVGVYAVQRFAWEFLKPYPTVAGPFNLFHLACLALGLYAGAMIIGRRSGQDAR